MKIAFCFLTIGDLLQPKIWDAFFRAAAQEKYSVYCHPKKPQQVTSPTLRDRIIKDHTPTQHGHVSLVEATLKLFAQAYDDAPDIEYFALISESAIPLVSFGEFYAAVERKGPRSIVGYQIVGPKSEHYQRLRAVQQPERFSSAFFYHEQWVILHRRHVALLLDHPGLNLFSNVYAPDEHYFMNALIHLKRASLDQFANHRATFVNWREREVRPLTNPVTREVIGQTVHPKTYSRLSAADLAEATRADCWFFRKVTAESDCSLVSGRLERERVAA